MVSSSVDLERPIIISGPQIASREELPMRNQLRVDRLLTPHSETYELKNTSHHPFL